MPTFSDWVSITTAAAGTEVTGAINVPQGSRVIAIDVAGLDTDGVPAVVRLDCPSITTPQRYLMPANIVGAVAAGLANPSAHRDVDVTIPSGANQLTVGLISLGAAGTWYVGVTWVK